MWSFRYRSMRLRWDDSNEEKNTVTKLAAHEIHPKVWFRHPPLPREHSLQVVEQEHTRYRTSFSIRSCHGAPISSHSNESRNEHSRPHSRPFLPRHPTTSVAASLVPRMMCSNFAYSPANPSRSVLSCGALEGEDVETIGDDWMR